MKQSKSNTNEIEHILLLWQKKLKTPDKGEFNFLPLKGRNILLVKDDKNRIGLLIIGTKQLDKSIQFKNFHFSYFKELKSKSQGKVYQRCVMVLADKNVNADYLINILFGIFKIESKMDITSKDLIDVMNKVQEMFDPKASIRNEVIGLWGELHCLNTLLARKMSNELKEQLISAWESKTGRKKIDFRFIESKIAIEVKTTTSEKRIHHFSGHEQFLIPDGFNKLLFQSISITDDEAGFTCKNISDIIRDKLDDAELIEDFNERLVIRGWSIANDNEFRFTSRDKSDIYLFDSSSYLLPTQPKGISNIEWELDLDISKNLSINQVNTVIKNITDI
jgi:hypothetical protein